MLFLIDTKTIEHIEADTIPSIYLQLHCPISSNHTDTL